MYSREKEKQPMETMEQKKPHMPRPRRPREAAPSSTAVTKRLRRKRWQVMATEMAPREFQLIQYPPTAAAHEARNPRPPKEAVYSKGYGVSFHRFQKGFLVRTALGGAASGHFLLPLSPSF